MTNTPLKLPELPRADFIKVISDPTLTRASVEGKRANLLKLYKALSPERKHEIAKSTVDILVDKFKSGTRLEGLVYVMICAFASERDWESMHFFIRRILETSSNSELYKEFAMILLDIADNDLGEKNSRLPLGQTALVMLTEMGLLLANQSGQSNLEYKEVSRVVEYITTNLLARSNMNNTAIRVALIHYLTQAPVQSNATLQLNRVIGRFGQSLLDELLLTFFEDKKRGNAAFHFLVENLQSFFSSTPSLAEMSHNVLKHYMLKFSDDFPSFLASYFDQAKKEPENLRMSTRLISTLLRTAIEVSQRSLFDSLKKLLFKHFHSLGGLSVEDADEHVQVCLQIIHSNQANAPTNIRGKNFMMDEIIKEIQQFRIELREQHKEQTAQKTVSLGKIKKIKELPVKMAKFGDRPSPLESMLQLAC